MPSRWMILPGKSCHGSHRAVGIKTTSPFFCTVSPRPSRSSFPPEASQLAPTRAALRGWLARAGVDPDQTLNVLIAAGEALANAIEHGHRQRTEGTISLRATALVDRLHLTVIDAGSWKPPVAAAHRGRGIALMQALMQDVTIQPRDTGTTVHMHTRIA